MNHQGKAFSSLKNARVWQLHCKEASSGRQPAEQPRQEGGEQQWHVHVSTSGIYWGITCAASEDWTQLIFVCRGDRVLHCSSTWESIQSIYSHCTRPAVPGLLALCCWVLPAIISAPHFSKSSNGDEKLPIPKGSVIHNSSSASLPVRGRASYQISSHQREKGKHWLSCLESCSASPAAVALLGRRGGEGALLALMLCSAELAVLERSTTAASSCTLQHPSCRPIHPRQAFCPAPRNCTRENSFWKWPQ